jgi:glycosyltransferase involved in cell wall biosynthesis
MSAIRVSVVLPVYNGARYLEEAVRSVLAQEHDGFELLLCDDASRDRSAELLARFASDPRVRVLRNDQNLGLFPTLNRLLREARADRIRLFAQDDVMYAGCLVEEERFLEAHPEVAMCYCAFDTLDERSDVVRKAPEDRTPDVLLPEQASELMFYYGSLTGNIANITLKRATLKAVGAFREDLRVSGDFDLLVRIAECHRIGFVRTPLIGLRAHAGQLSRHRDSSVLFMHENRALRETLLARLPQESRAHARRYLRRRIHPQHAHHAARRLLAGDVLGAIGTLSALRSLDRPLPVAFWWLVTGNGRWLVPRPRLRTF